MRIARLLLVFTLAIYPALSNAQPQQQSATIANASAPDLSAIRAFYRTGVERNGIVGSTLVLVDNGRVLLDEPYGDQSLAPKTPVDEHTTYHWASVT
ncbi:MAG TPA: serine hydrolase, partial [Acidobacteriaceae bacterium]|nr:serine hydrolase [Acidobacteriaceae bacterium]